jgi:hypothetical protein
MPELLIRIILLIVPIIRLKRYFSEDKVMAERIVFDPPPLQPKAVTLPLISFIYAEIGKVADIPIFISVFIGYFFFVLNHFILLSDAGMTPVNYMSS